VNLFRRVAGIFERRGIDMSPIDVTELLACECMHCGRTEASSWATEVECMDCMDNEASAAVMVSEVIRRAKA
jgi:hypothetical protein